MEFIMTPELWVAFLTLTALEIVLGIDNIIFISILVSRLPKEQQAKGRIFGLGLAMFTRIGLLLSITWVMRLTTDLFHLFGQGISGRDLILFFGGLFLLFKSSSEIYHGLEGEEEPEAAVADPLPEFLEDRLEREAFVAHLVAGIDLAFDVTRRLPDALDRGD